MGQFRWTQQSIEWFLSASAYTGFHTALADHLRPYLNPTDVVCDFGCGLGQIDLSLSPSVRQITAIDSSKEAIDVLSRQVSALGISNIDCICGDARILAPICDVGIMSFFGRTEKELLYYSGLCRKKLLFIANIVNDSALSPMSQKKMTRQTAKQMSAKMEQCGLVFSQTNRALEFGQPLVSYEDALALASSHTPDATEQELVAFLAQHLQKRQDKKFPFYLPNSKQVGLFVLDCTNTTNNKYVRR